MLEIKPRQCIGIGKSLICIRAESMTSPLFITQEKSVFLHTNLVPSSILIRWFTNEGLPPYIIKWIVVSFHMEKHNRNNRLAQACPLSTLSPVFGSSIKKKNTNKRSDHLAMRETVHFILFSAKTQIYKQNTYRTW